MEEKFDKVVNWNWQMVFGTGTKRPSTAYACVVFRIMGHEGSELTEEYLDMLMGILYDFYTADEIQKIYAQNIIFDSYDAVVNDMIVKRKINGAVKKVS